MFPTILLSMPRQAVLTRGAAICILALFAFAAPNASAQTAVVPSGTGLTTDTAYQITVLGNLVWLHDQAAANLTEGKYYKLINNINASETSTWNNSGTDTSVLEGFNPIGVRGGSYTFKGTFLGQGYTITGLYIRQSNDGVGMFGGTGTAARILDLHLAGGSISTGAQYVGGLVGYNTGYISGCSNTGTVDGSNSYIGGLVGYNEAGTITRCYATSAVTANVGVTTTAASGVGGLVGCSHQGLVTLSYATGAVTSGDYSVGGLAGQNYSGTITYCHATGATVGNEYVGGLCGHSSGSIAGSYATGKVTGLDCEAGGLLGRNMYGSVTRCYATGTVTSSGNCNGGLVGYSYSGTISKSYATGAVKGSYGGGLVGGNGGTITECYSIGAVSGTSTIGGLIGASDSGVTNSYWNTASSGQTSSAGGSGYATSAMLQQATYGGFDFTTTWKISGSYPYLAELTTTTLTYTAGSGGRVSNGATTTNASLVEVINVYSVGASVTALPDSGSLFLKWSDARTSNPRTDANTATAYAVTAIFSKNAVANWTRYE